jgi:hypothetical protein
MRHLIRLARILHDGSSANRSSASLAWDEDARFLPILRFTRKSSEFANAAEVFMNNGGLVQCLDAVVAPMPVSDRTCCARKPPRSFAAWLLRSRIENNQMPMTPIVIENSAGEV